MTNEEHPVAAHTYQLDNLQARVTELETKVLALLEFKSASQEQAKTIFNILQELKEMLKEYTTEMRTTLTSMSDNITKKFDEKISEVEGKVQEIEKRPGRRWDAVVSTIITVIITAILTSIVGSLIMQTKEIVP